MDKFFLASLVLFLLVAIATSEDKLEDMVKLDQPLLAHFGNSQAAAVKSGNVEISLVYTTTSSMGITWQFANYTPNGTIEAVFVGWDLNYGRFVSNRLHSLEHEFEFTHLQADTSYLVCVEILEKYAGRIISHVQCSQLSTIAPMRADSILVLLLVLGYFILMPVLGCLLWRRKLSQLGGGGSSGHTLGENYGHDKKVMRWKDIEERIVLNPNAET